MADPESTLPEADIEMEGAEENPVEVDDNDDEPNVPPTQDPEDDAKPLIANPQTRFLDYLRSPMIQLNIGGDSSAISAHRAILTMSPYFNERLASEETEIDMPDEDLDAMGCFLQYQYTGEYFPRRLANQPDGLEHDPSAPAIDNTGDQLLKHARVYTLAEKLGLPELQSLAHSKIHRINSSAVGEIAYARYVYSHSSPEDTTIRKPVAAFWATRSHVLRHEAEAEFKSMCLEFPQFGFDVLTLVLDSREKRAAQRADDTGAGSTPARGRKRMRPSVNI
ncbi:hypothetical protein LTS08_000289 [Lithohypha guttulata]|nr:hypothetical protein LTS08_000289 [Lithohypha guttulata]